MSDDSFPALSEGETLIEPSDELLFRQVTTLPQYWDDSVQKPSTTAFGPASIDAGKASYTRSSVVSAQESRNWHHENATTPSRGVWAVSTAEVSDRGSRSVDDSVAMEADTSRPTPPGHCFVDYQGLAKKEERKLRGLLHAAAMDRAEIPTINPADT